MPELRCTICADSRSPEMVIAYLRLRSLRRTALLFGVGYKSLDRHLTDCVPRIYSEYQEELFQQQLARSAKLLRTYFGRRYNAPRLDMRVPRPKSIVTKEVEFSWSRRGWKKNGAAGKEDTAQDSKTPKKD